MDDIVKSHQISNYDEELMTGLTALYAFDELSFSRAYYGICRDVFTNHWFLLEDFVVTMSTFDKYVPQQDFDLILMVGCELSLFKEELSCN